jgi:hypothetical protein
VDNHPNLINLTRKAKSLISIETFKTLKLYATTCFILPDQKKREECHCAIVYISREPLSHDMLFLTTLSVNEEAQYEIFQFYRRGYFSA